MNWLQKTSQSISINMGNYSEKLHDYIYKLVSDNMDNPNRISTFSYEDADKEIARLTKETEQNMHKIVQIINNAVSSIEWGGSAITVQVAEPPCYELYCGPDYLEPVRDAYIGIGKKTEWGGQPNFTLFVSDDQLEVDDILEAGDEDFFTDSITQSDYFALVRELRNPGSSRSTKVLALYTARPVKDRSIYLDATEIPSNLFLTSSYDRAFGIGLDLGGKEGRDIWKIWIDEKYLINTMDSGYEKDFQVVDKEKVPIRKIKLITPGLSSGYVDQQGSISNS